jgi:DNA-binding NarL/FixJ family response regulator
MASMNTPARIHVFIVDDLPSMRERLRELVDGVDGIEVVGEAGTPGEAIDGIRRMHPDYVLLDYQLVGGTGIDVLRAIHADAPDIAFIVLTNHATPQHRCACLRAGARFFFDKSTEFGRVRSAIAESRLPRP